MAGRLEGPADLPPVVRLVRDQVADERRRVRLEPLTFPPAATALRIRAATARPDPSSAPTSFDLPIPAFISTFSRPSRPSGAADFSHNRRTKFIPLRQI